MRAGAVFLLAACAPTPTTVRVTLSAAPSLPPVSTLSVDLTYSGSTITRGLTPPSAPIAYPATFTVTLSDGVGHLGLTVRGLDGQGRVVGAGTGGADTTVGDITDVAITLLPPMPQLDGGAPDQSSPDLLAPDMTNRCAAVMCPGGMAGSYCNPATGLCQQCVTDDQCPAGSLCQNLGEMSFCYGGCTSAHLCPMGQSCTDGGMCQGPDMSLSCSSGMTLCNGTCVNTVTDNSNCGACGVTCTGNLQCLSSVCDGCIISSGSGGANYCPRRCEATWNAGQTKTFTYSIANFATLPNTVIWQANATLDDHYMSPTNYCVTLTVNGQTVVSMLNPGFAHGTPYGGPYNNFATVSVSFSKSTLGQGKNNVAVTLGCAGSSSDWIVVQWSTLAGVRATSCQ